MPQLGAKRSHGSAALPQTSRKSRKRTVTETPLTTKPRPAVLAIDLGNTSTRCEIAALEANPGRRVSIAVRVEGYNSLDTVGVGAADFPNQVNPFGLDNDLSIHHVARGESISIPLKEMFYIECLLWYQHARNYKQIQRIINQIPQLKSFWKAYIKLDVEERNKVFRRLETLFREHIKILKERCHRTEEENEMEITKIVLTTPGNWDAIMCDSLVLRTTDAWNLRAQGMEAGDSKIIQKDGVEHISESDAIAHWLVFGKPKSWLVSTKSKHFLLADFGGHTLNLYRFTVCYNEENNSFSFFSCKNGYTAHHGGSDCHTALVRDEVKFFLRNDKRGFTPVQREALLESAMRDYRFNKLANIDGTKIILTASPGGDLNPILIPLNARKCKQFYEDTLGDLLEIFELRVKAASSLQDTHVIAIGGTFQNKHLLRKAKKIVLEHNLVWDETKDITLDPYYPSSVVAKGAALGIQDSMSARQFVDSSCFALNPGVAKDDKLEIPIIMRKSNPVTAIVRVSLSAVDRDNGKKKKDVEISVAPWRVDEDATGVFRPKTYCVHTLWLDPARYKIWMNFVTEPSMEHDGQPQDYLILYYVRVKKQPDGTWEEIGDRQQEKLPIFYQLGQRLIQVDIDMMESKSEKTTKKNTTRNRRVARINYAEDDNDDVRYDDDGYCTCLEIQDPISLGDWGKWEHSISVKDQLEKSRQDQNDGQENANVML